MLLAASLLLTGSQAGGLPHLRHHSSSSGIAAESLYDLTAVDITGKIVDLSTLRGTPSLVVNVATH